MFLVWGICFAMGQIFAAETDTATAPLTANYEARPMLFLLGEEAEANIAIPLTRASADIAPIEAYVLAIINGCDLDGNKVKGAREAAPNGTQLAGVETPEPNKAIIRLIFPDGSLQCSNFGGLDSDRLTKLIQSTLLETFDINHLLILVRENQEDDLRYKNIVDRLMENIPHISKAELDGYKPVADPKETDLREVGGFPATTGNTPQGFLSGKGVFINSAHGVVYRSKSNRWGLQRGLLLELNEDIHVAEMVNWYLSNYLRNAGAQVWPERELDFQTNMVIVDSLEGSMPANSGACTKTGTWTTVNGKGFKLYTPPNRTSNLPFRAGTGSYERAAVTKSGTPTATAVFTPKIPVEGYYHVYISFVGAADQARGAHVGIRHTGGESEQRIIQTRDGNTWVWLGNFHFDAGQDSNKGAVAVYNDVAASDAGSYVAIDAVRFGGGMGDIQRYDAEFFPSGPYVGSGKERWHEEARYYLQFTGMTSSQFDSTCYESVGHASANQRDECDGWSARPRYVNFETEAGEDNCYLAIHTNAAGSVVQTTARGLSTYISSTSNAASKTFRGYVHDQIYSDVMATYAPTVWRSNKNTGDYGENNQNSLGESPGFLIELLFHDNVDDCEFFKDPKFRQVCARAMYKGIVKYYANRDGKTAVFLPELPTHLRVQRQSATSARVSWRAPASGGVLGNPAAGYIVQRSLNGKGFDDGQKTSQTYFDFTDLTPNTVYYFRVIATNAGGISFPSDVLAVRTGSDAPRILFVQGYDRLDRFLPPLRSWYSVLTRFQELRIINSFNYVIQHAKALHGIDANFDSTSNEAVGAGDINLSAYSLVIWAAGQQAEADTSVDKIVFRAFTADEKTRLRAFTMAGGNLFVTGSEIWWDMDRSASIAADDRAFVKDILGAAYVADSAWPTGTATWKCNGVSGSIFNGLTNIAFDDGTMGAYKVSFPEVIAAQTNATVCLRYQSATASSDVAGIQRLGTASKVVALGVPFETIYPEATRTEIMRRVINALVSDGPLPTPGPSPTPTPTPTPTPIHTRFEDFEAGSAGELWMFRSAGFSGSTIGIVAGSSSSAVTDAESNNILDPAVGAQGKQSARLAWTWEAPLASNAKARCTSYSSATNTINRPNPLINLKMGLSFYIRVSKGDVKLSVWIRETGGEGPIGADGGLTGAIEETATVRQFSASPEWQYVYIDFSTETWQTVNGNGAIDGDWGVLEALTFRPVEGTSAGEVEIFVDDFCQGPQHNPLKPGNPVSGFLLK